MSKPAVIYYEIQGFQQSSLELLNDRFEVHTFANPHEVDPAVLGKVEGMFAPMGFIYDKPFLDKASNLKGIGTPTTGTMHIDEEEAATRGVKICSLKTEKELLLSISPTAELAWGLIIAVTRHMLPAFDAVKQGEWDGKHWGRKTPRMLSKMRLGVIGLGRLGAYVAKYGVAFGMEVGYYDPYIESDEYRRFDSPLELAAESDVVSLHVHATPETNGLVDESFLNAMPEGGFLINTARGDLVDEAALLKALRSSHLAGAGIDMVTGDHLPGFADTRDTHPLFKYAREHDNLVITPHYGGATRDAWERTEQRIINNLWAACTGQEEI